MLRVLNCLLVIIFLAAVPALARDEPPTRVGRVSFVSGKLAFHTPGQNEWLAAEVNYPVATGTSLWTEPDGRAEIRIGPNTIAMTGNTELDLGRLTTQITQINLPQGRIYLHVRQLDDTHTFEIAIPRGGILLLQPGYYDIDAGSEDQPARIAVFEGAARFAGNGADIEVKPGDVAVLNGTNPVTASIERVVADAFAEWCRSRDYDDKRLAAPYLVSPNMTGYAELDAGGRWDTAPAYGEVWYPNVLGALHARPVGLDRAVGLDLDRRRAVGVRAVAFRALGLYRRALVLGPRQLCGVAGLRTGAGRLPRRPGHRALRRGGGRTASRLVSARPGRNLLAELRGRPELCSCAQPRQCRKCRRHPVTARRPLPRPGCECAVRQSPLCDGRSARRLRERRQGRPGGAARSGRSVRACPSIDAIACDQAGPDAGAP